jgi:hypothetical protein
MPDYLARLKARSAATADADAVLTDARLNDILDEYSLPDLDNLQPTDPAWTPTYDLNGAIAAAWLEKAGMLANVFKASPAQGISFELQQRYDHAHRHGRAVQRRQLGRRAAVDSDRDRPASGGGAANRGGVRCLTRSRRR